MDLVEVRRDDGTSYRCDDPELTLPHPRAHLRAFVLVPWRELEPDAAVPAVGTVADLLASPPVAPDVPGVRRRHDLDLRAWQTA